MFQHLELEKAQPAGFEDQRTDWTGSCYKLGDGLVTCLLLENWFG